MHKKRNEEEKSQEQPVPLSRKFSQELSFKRNFSTLQISPLTSFGTNYCLTSPSKWHLTNSPVP